MMKEQEAKDGGQNECCGETGTHSVHCEYAALKWQNHEDGYNISRLTAENQRLRTALDEALIGLHNLEQGSILDTPSSVAQRVRKIASAALGGE
jgi:hypothetical protein